MNGLSISLLLINAIATTEIQAIMNGRLAQDGDFPYQVSLWELNHHICGGAIISTVHVITAAHCVHGKIEGDYTVYAGITSLEDSDLATSRNVRSIHRHPKYNPYFVPPEEQKNSRIVNHQENDIAVLTLDYPLRPDDIIKVVALPTQDVIYGSTCKAAGWGETHKLIKKPAVNLHWTTATILTPEKCAAEGVLHRASEFCAIHGDGGSTMCKGDSGSPLVCDGVLVGIVMSSHCDPKYPVTYAKVYGFLSFIKKARNGDGVRTSHEDKTIKYS